MNTQTQTPMASHISFGEVNESNQIRIQARNILIILPIVSKV